MNKTNIIIGASFLALVALITFQVKWMTDSRQLIEEQFNQKVSMAMCYAVDILGPDLFEEVCTPGTGSCLPVQETYDGFQLETKNIIANVPKIKEAIAVALDLYKIDMDYSIAVNKKHNFFQGVLPTYTCALNPLEKGNEDYLTIQFTGKDEYIFGKMKFMFFTSIIILGFITLIFILSSYTMLRQRKMQQFNKEFFNNMAHEFRTPLANISLAGTLLSKTQTNPKEQKYLHVLKDESKKLASQVDRILQLSKIENGEYQLAKEKLCLKDLIQQVIQGMSLQIKEKNATVNIDVENVPVEFEGDQFHLGNVFRNLIENALKYSKNTPTINITLKKDKDGFLINFQDNGIGIAKHDQKEIFEKYYRVNNGNIHNQKGFGLGLAYVKTIIERHKGVIKIFSDLNKGTRFDLFLPVRES